MRCLIIAVGLGALISNALAADYDGPVLRGSDTFIPATPQYFSWQGIYAGGEAGYGNAVADFTTATDPLVAYALRNSTVEDVATFQVLGPANTSAAGFGAFVGYNMQWDSAVLGVELEYNYSPFNITSPVAPIARSNVPGTDGSLNDIEITGSSSMKIIDYSVLRGRAGWAVENLLPYATFGVAIGRANIATSATVFGLDTSAIPEIPFSFTQSQTKNSQLLYGYAAGGGLDAALGRTLFARAEYEYISFSPVQGIAAHINETRLGLGVKF